MMQVVLPPGEIAIKKVADGKTPGDDQLTLTAGDVQVSLTKEQLSQIMSRGRSMYGKAIAGA